MTTTERRPAIPHDPLPQAGDSLRDQLYEIVYDKAMFWLLAVLVSCVCTFVAWWQYFFPSKNLLAGPVILSLATMVMGLIAFFKVRRLLSHTKRIKLGLRGELHVGQYLNRECAKLGYHVFHDIQCKSAGDFNIDHVLVGPGGVFSIETKNWSKPPQGTRAEIVFDPQSNRLTRSDGSYDDAAVAQAIANADYLEKLLMERTARTQRIPVRPVLVLPGWWVTDSISFQQRAVWILGDNSLHKLLVRERGKLSAAEIADIAASLTHHQREQK